ncbi:phosphoglucomutase [Clostridia bacterium]|nr:phosphoglucomutase [Clostridia bacterium]
MSENITLLNLQNGSDVRGVAMETEGGAPVNLTPDIAEQIATAFSLWLADRTNKPANCLRIGVGHDSRLTAETLKAAMITGFASQGASVFDCGLASTPAMFMGTVFDETGFDGSVMITASHLPQNRNGIKFFTKSGGVEKADVTAILQRAETPGAPTEPKAASSGKAGSCELMALYSAFLRKKIVDGAGGGELPLQGMHIVVDAGNGAGGFFARDVLLPLGADCEGSQFLEPDGNFPNHPPNPENKEAMQAICGAVNAAKADLGIIFDTDVDRMSAVLPDGTPVNRNAIIALMSAVIAPDYPGATIVTDSVTSDLLTDFLQERLGLKHHCFRRGYRNVIGEAIRLNAGGILSPLAIETSGHGALKENYFLDDGAYMAVRIISAAAKAKAAGKRLDSLLDGFTTSGFETEFRITIIGEGFTEYGKKVLEAFAQRAEEQGLNIVPGFEGIRISFSGKGWVLLRLSLHDPVLPMNIEANDATEGTALLQTAKELLSGFDRLEFPE